MEARQCECVGLTQCLRTMVNCSLKRPGDADVRDVGSRFGFEPSEFQSPARPLLTRFRAGFELPMNKHGSEECECVGPVPGEDTSMDEADNGPEKAQNECAYRGVDNRARLGALRCPRAHCGSHPQIASVITDLQWLSSEIEALFLLVFALNEGYSIQFRRGGITNITILPIAFHLLRWFCAAG